MQVTEKVPQIPRRLENDDGFVIVEDKKQRFMPLETSLRAGPFPLKYLIVFGRLLQHVIPPLAPKGGVLALIVQRGFSVNYCIRMELL
jgi:hypothetical protein